MIKKVLNALRNPRKTLNRVKNLNLKTAYTKYLEKSKMDKKMVFYESYHGKNATGNAYALFLKLLSNKKYNDYTHIWALNDLNGPSAQLVKRYKNVIVVKRGTHSYVKYLAKAKYLINNTSFPYYFQKKEGQVYINTWHGTPLKYIGSDALTSGVADHGNIQKNFLQTDFLVSPNKFTYENLLRANCVDGIFNGVIIDAGYPRVDSTFRMDPAKLKNELGLDPNKKVILYAPTWRDSDTKNPEESVKNFYEYFQSLESKFSNNYQIVLKVHYFIYEHFKNKGLEKYCIPDHIDTNEILSFVDILITDYSSIFFEFLHTKKPILFFAYDKEKYLSERGLYLDMNELPGPVCETVNELIDAIDTIDEINKKYEENYQKMIERFAYHDDGNASERVLDIIFEGKKSEFALKPEKSNKKKLFIWGGGFTTNGITISLVNLLNNIDYSKFDVTLLFASKLNDVTKANLEKINQNVRIVYRVGTLNYHFHEAIFHKAIFYLGLNNKWARKIVPKKLYQREFKRIVGNATFDIGIDFCGYTPLWTLMFAFNEFSKKNIYLHSDMMADSKRNPHFRRNFDVTFNLYSYFDKLIGVAKDTTEINKTNFEKRGLQHKIVNVDNALDFKRVLEHTKDFKIDDMPLKENVNFVTVGRLSPEKDQEKLIRAFSNVHKIHPNTRLYVVGNGILKNHLTELVKEIGLDGKVILTGEMNNPFALVNACNCFVLSSNYEGQGLSLLEALILNKPVISTDIPGPRGILQYEYGELVENSVEGLEEGMKRFILERPKYEKFDYITYNKHAIESFYHQVCDVD